MIGVDEALAVVLAAAPRMRAETLPLLDAVGRATAADVYSDEDLPPFRKSAMDGYALRAEDLAATGSFEVVETIPAGCVPRLGVGPGQASRIMTGAPMPAGADTVVRVEDVDQAPGCSAGDRVRVLVAPAPQANVCGQGEDLGRGQVAVAAGTLVRPQEVAVLAAVGCSRVPVFGRPSVAVVATGDEVVDVGVVPTGAQVRDANSHALAARLWSELGIRARILGMARDDPGAVACAVREGLRSDVLLLTGGISAGDFDVVPDALAACGVEILFRSVAVKPGRPTTFGRVGRTLVFGLPGNPVAVQVIGEILVLPALRAMMGIAEPAPRAARAVLSGRLRSKGDRRVYRPVRVCWEGDEMRATPVRYNGTADLPGLARGNALAVLAEGTTGLADGDFVDVVLL